MRAQGVTIIMFVVGLFAVVGGIVSLVEGQVLSRVFVLGLVGFAVWRLFHSRGRRPRPGDHLSRRQLLFYSVVWAFVGALCVAASLLLYAPHLAFRILGVSAGIGAFLVAVKAQQRRRRMTRGT